MTIKHPSDHARLLFLNVSELSVSGKPLLIKTILGSCVAVVISVPRLQLSAICHARLPQGESVANKKNGFCYVDSAIDFMVLKLYSLGAKKAELIVKAFGGAQVIFADVRMKKTGQLSNKKSIGEQNISAVHAGLKKHGLQLANSDFGGTSGRKLIYNTLNNEVSIKMLSKEVVTENKISLLLKDFIFNR